MFDKVHDITEFKGPTGETGIDGRYEASGMAGPKGIPGNLPARDYHNDETMYNYYSENFGGNYRCLTDKQMSEIECTSQWRDKTNEYLERSAEIYGYDGINHKEYFRVLEKSLDFISELKALQTEIEHSLVTCDKNEMIEILKKSRVHMPALDLMLHIFVYRNSQYLTKAQLKDAEYILDTYSTRVSGHLLTNEKYYD